MPSRSTIDGQRATEQWKTKIAAQQKEIADLNTNISHQLSSLNTQVQQLSPTDVQSGAISGTEDTYEDEAGTPRTIGDEHAILCILLELLEALKTKMQDEAKKAAEKEQDPRVTFGDRNSGFQLGINRGSISGFTFGGHVSREDSGI